MNTCKNCNKDLGKATVPNFCSANCVIEYEENKSKSRFQKKHPENVPVHYEVMMKKINRSGSYFIHNKTLSGYVNSSLFDDFIKDNNLMIVRLEDKEFNLSVIKRSII